MMSDIVLIAGVNELNVAMTPIVTGDIWELTIGGGSFFRRLDPPPYRVHIDIQSDTCAADLITALSDPRIKFFTAFGHGSGEIVYRSLKPTDIAYHAGHIQQALIGRPPINISVTHHCYAAVKNKWAEIFTKGFQPKCISLATLYPYEGGAWSGPTLNRTMNTIVKNPSMLCYDAYLEAIQYYGLPKEGDNLVFYGDKTTKLDDIIGGTPGGEANGGGWFT